MESIRRQRALLGAEIGRFAKPGDRYALVDFPNYANVGDSAIWLGARAILSGLTLRPPVHVAGNRKRDLIGLRRRLGDGTIYVSGGGNFGDLWPRSQHLRETLMARFPDNRIVQLPQSIHFESDKAAARCAAAIRRHGDFHLLARDAATAAFALARFDCSVRLSPDCAFGLGALSPSADPQHSLFALLRTDKESSAADYSAIGALRPQIGDWCNEYDLAMNRLKLALWTDLVRARSPGGSAVRTELFDSMARARLERGILMLSSGGQVVTDRLHGHILCLLLGIPHVALDNSYGKVGGYYRQWTKGMEGGLFAAGAEEAVASLAMLHNRCADAMPELEAAE